MYLSIKTFGFSIYLTSCIFIFCIVNYLMVSLSCVLKKGSFCLASLCAYIKRQLWECCQFNRISPLMMTKIVFGSQSIDKQGRTVIENRISINLWLTFHWFPMLLTTVCSSFKDEKKFSNEESTQKYPWLVIWCTHCSMLQT